MANPTPAAIAAIRARVSDWTPGDQQIADALNVADQANPIPAPPIPKPMDSETLLGKISNVAKGKVYRQPAIVGLQNSIHSGDRKAVKSWFALALVGGDIGQAEYNDLVTEIDATIPDPRWPDKVSWAQINLGRPADAADIAAARPGA